MFNNYLNKTFAVPSAGPSVKYTPILVPALGIEIPLALPFELPVIQCCPLITLLALSIFTVATPEMAILPTDPPLIASAATPITA